MLRAAVGLIGELFGAAALPGSELFCNHNHVRAEQHHGERLWVHRKGAISAGDGEVGIIPGSMGSASSHVLGRGCAEALRSSSHGAGRCLSRSEARRRITVREMARQLHGIWYDHRGAAALREEAPGAYKDIEQVMRAQRELTRIVRRLRPRLCYKGC